MFRFVLLFFFYRLSRSEILSLCKVASTLCEKCYESDFLKMKKTLKITQFFRSHAFDGLFFDHYVRMSHVDSRTYLAIFLQCVQDIGKKEWSEKQIKKLTAYLRCRSAKVDIDVFSSRIESNALNQIKIFTALWRGAVVW